MPNTLPELPGIPLIDQTLFDATRLLEAQLHHSPQAAHPLEALHALRRHAVHAGALATQLLRETWWEHGELPPQFNDIPLFMWGGGILPARMHQPNHHIANARLSIVDNRTIKGDRGRRTFEDDEGHDERMLILFNGLLAYRNTLPDSVALEDYLGHHPSEVVKGLKRRCAQVTGVEDAFFFRGGHRRGQFLRFSPLLCIDDRRGLPMDS